MTDRSLLDRPPNYDHDYDGRPSVLHGFDGDPLLERLWRFHPERIPDELAAKIKADRGRVILASALAEPAASLSQV